MSQPPSQPPQGFWPDDVPSFAALMLAILATNVSSRGAFGSDVLCPFQDLATNELWLATHDSDGEIAHSIDICYFQKEYSPIVEKLRPLPRPPTPPQATDPEKVSSDMECLVDGVHCLQVATGVDREVSVGSTIVVADE
ncbi:hypothetical protein EIP91_010594 [Steccherinum ochraceum]|uniref:Uncharacterized protein n=1 Tax=Steccherinum ochraceum TaxID=92696 RepID=A0A4R0R944_9APHY|nr:hypothetical protein EIP91_010594 [Steccherinum ochraceum]